MKKRYNINLDTYIQEKGVLQAKEKSKKRKKYVSFSSHIEELIVDHVKKETKKS